MSELLAAGISVGVDLCRALEIDPVNVQRISVTVGAEDIVKVHILRLVTTSQAHAMKSVLESYTFRTVGDE
jgi:hypothetical protein